MVSIMKLIAAAAVLCQASALVINSPVSSMPGSTSVTVPKQASTTIPSVVATGAAGVLEVDEPVLAVRPTKTPTIVRAYQVSTTTPAALQVTGTGAMGNIIVGDPVLATRSSVAVSKATSKATTLATVTKAIPTSNFL